MRTALLSLLLAACATSASQSPGAEPRPTSTTGQTLSAGLPQSGVREQGMWNCPTTLPGVKTLATNTATGIDLSVTTTDPTVSREILALARRHSYMGQPGAAASAHTGLHGGPGTVGHCPVIHGSTRVTFTESVGGAVIHIDALSPQGVEAVQSTVRDRLARLASR